MNGKLEFWLQSIEVESRNYLILTFNIPWINLGPYKKKKNLQDHWSQKAIFMRLKKQIRELKTLQLI